MGSSKTRSNMLTTGTLVVIEGPHLGAAFDVHPEYTLIGRAEGLGISLPDDDLVSRQHARVITTGDGCEIRDLVSENGTHVNGVRIETSVLLRYGDTIRVGSVVLRFSAPSR